MSKSNLYHAHDLVIIKTVHAVSRRYSKVSRVASNTLSLLGQCALLCGGLAQVYNTVFNLMLKDASKNHSCFIVHVTCKTPIDVHLLKSWPIKAIKISDIDEQRLNIIEGTHALVICFISSRGWVVDPTVGAAMPLCSYLKQKESGSDEIAEDEWYDLENRDIKDGLYQFYTSRFFINNLGSFKIHDKTDRIIDRIVKFKLFMGV